MSQVKKDTRSKFRFEVFKRDKTRCKVCQWGEDITKLDSHHIIDRREIDNGGYVKENGITLCPMCHLAAEQFHLTGVARPGYSREELFDLIGSSEEKARESAGKYVSSHVS